MSKTSTIALVVGFLRLRCQCTMDFNQNSTGAFINPHAKRPAAENAASESNNRVNNVPVDSAVADFFTMGIQSQSCNGTKGRSQATCHGTR
jgi:hypothetical protein